MVHNGRDFTSATGKAAQKVSARNRRAERNILKRQLRLEETRTWTELLRSTFASPVLAGTVAYFLVDGVERLYISLGSQEPSHPSHPQTTNAPTTKPDFLAVFWNALSGTLNSTNPILGQITSGIGNLITQNGTQPFGANIDFIALKAAILAYIASGGNLAGLLSSATGGIKTLAPILGGA